MALRVAEGDHLSERSEGRKLPQHKTRALARLRTLKTLLRGCFGGDARGAEKGAQPHNRPHLAARRAGVPTFAEGRNSVPAGQQKSKDDPRRGGENACRAGVLNFVGRRNSVPAGQKKQIITLWRGEPHAAQASQTSPEGEIPCPQGGKNQAFPRRGCEIPPPTIHPTHTTQASAHQDY